ncbi:hypothetical protein [uncultured Winogradskyella sp.]|uniref:hypothetical protein n=1 Tax=uncultured Winogradskyella sp. TaxID=395353 RepID=UPI0035137871
MKTEILHNLEKLLEQSLSYTKGATIGHIITNYINETNQNYLSIGINHYLDDEEPIELNKLKENNELNESFQKALKLNLDENLILSKFKTDLQNAFSEIKLIVQSEKKGIKNQAIFLEHDFLPIASISGFGKGNYPILEKPKYLDFYPKEEIYINIEKIDYSLAWKDLLSLNNVLEKFEIDDYIIESDIYQALNNSFKFKTYIILHKAFDELGIKILDGIEIEKPVMIYGNEHDCEPINIYAFE